MLHGICSVSRLLFTYPRTLSLGNTWWHNRGPPLWWRLFLLVGDLVGGAVGAVLPPRARLACPSLCAVVGTDCQRPALNWACWRATLSPVVACFQRTILRAALRVAQLSYWALRGSSSIQCGLSTDQDAVHQPSAVRLPGQHILKRLASRPSMCEGPPDMCLICLICVCSEDRLFPHHPLWSGSCNPLKHSGRPLCPSASLHSGLFSRICISEELLYCVPRLQMKCRTFFLPESPGDINPAGAASPLLRCCWSRVVSSSCPYCAPQPSDSRSSVWKIKPLERAMMVLRFSRHTLAHTAVHLSLIPKFYPESCLRICYEDWGPSELAACQMVVAIFSERH